MTKSKQIFLSYRSLEAEFALRLAADLKNAGINLWMDRLDIRPGQDWLRMLQNAVNDCDAMISILSPEYVTSRYCQKEMARADRLGRPIFPILLRPISAKSWPIEVERQQYIDFNEWRNEEIYKEQLQALLAILQEQDVAQIEVPDPETRYLTSLIAELEARKGVLEYVELSTETDKPLAQDYVRPEPRSAAAWSMQGAFTLVEDAAPGIEQVEGAPPQRKVPLNGIDDAREKYPRFVLIGPPGAGKTTTLNHLVLEAVHTYQTTPHVSPLPILLKLTNWKSGDSLEAFLHASWPFEDDPMLMLAKGRYALYLDGLNEMGAEHAEKAQALRQWLHGDYPPAYVVVTCRSADYTPELNLGLPTVEAVEMDKPRIQEFVTNYVPEDVAQPLLERILPQKAGDDQNTHQLYQLARNPFLLNVLILVYQSSPDRDLPHNMGALLKRLAGELWERERNRRGEGIVPLEDLETALSELAYRMIDAGSPVYVPREQALNTIGSPAYLEAGHGANFLEIEGGNVRFTYQLIQEYFAALGMARAGLPTKLAQPQFNPSGERIPRKWDKVIVALSGISPDADGIVRSIAEVDPFLAMECIASGINVNDYSCQQAAGRLLTVTRQPNAPGRVSAARLLAVTEHPQAPSFLLDTLRTGTWSRRMVAESVIGDLDVEPIEGLTDALLGLESYTRETTAAALRQLGEHALPHLLQLLKSDNFALRRGAAWALGTLKDAAAVPTLVQALRDDDAVVAAEATIALGWIRDGSVIPWLLEGFYHESWRVRKATAVALSWFGSPAVPYLLRALESDNEELRRLAVEALKGIRDPQVPDAVFEATYDPSPDVRAIAVEALRNVEVDVAVNRLIELLTDHARSRTAKQRISDIAARILELIGTPKALAAVAHWRGASGPMVRPSKVTTQTTKASNGVPKTATPSRNGKTARSGHDRLKDITGTNRKLPQAVRSNDLLSPNWVDRRNAIQALTNADEDVALPALLNALSDEDNQVRIAAVRVLSLLHDDAAIQGLLRALADEDYLVCDAAAEGLNHMGKRAVPGLIEVLQSNSLNLRGAALEILSKVADESAIPALAQCLTDSGKPWLVDQRVCDLAAQTLQRLGTPAALAALAEWQPALYGDEPLPFAAHTSPSVPSQDAPPLVLMTATADDDDGETVLAPVEPATPATQRPPVAQDELVAELLEAVRHSEWGARETAAKALRDYAKKLKGSSDTPAAHMLVDTLGDADWVLRWAAVEALAWIGDADTVPPLIEQLDDDQWLVRVAVIRALGEIGNVAAVPGVSEALSDPKDLVREAAAEALGTLGDRSAAPALARALADSERFVRLAAVQALGKLDDTTVVPSLAKLLRDNDNQLRWAAADALGKIGDEDAVALLIEQLQDKSGPHWEEKRVCDVVAEALETIGTPAAREAVEQWRRSQAEVS